MNVIGISINPDNFSRKELTSFLNTLREIRNWLVVNDSLIIIVSTSAAYDINEKIHRAFKNSNFFIFPIDKNEVNGWLPGKVWNFITEPSDSGYWDDQEN